MFCFCAESRRAARLLTARYDRHLAPAGLSSAQFELMSLIAFRQGINGRALAEALAVDPTTLSRNLRPLCLAKDVKTGKSAEDARLVLYSLTDRGKARLETAKPMWQAAHRETLGGLGSGSEPVRLALQAMTNALRVSADLHLQV